MLLDLHPLEGRGKLDLDPRKTGRANGKEKIPRHKYQFGCLFARWKRRGSCALALPGGMKKEVAAYRALEMVDGCQETTDN